MKFKEWKSANGKTVPVPKDIVAGMKHHVIIGDGPDSVDLWCETYHFKNRMAHFENVLVNTSDKATNKRMQLPWLSTTRGVVITPMPSKEDTDD